MSSRQFLSPYTEQRVILGAVSDELQQDENLEPPFVRIRSKNTAHVYIDTSYTSSVNPANIVVGYQGGDLFTRKVKRYAVDGLEVPWVTPNVNIRNNSLTFAVDTIGNTFTATIPEGFYPTVVGLFTALATAMTTASSDTFTVTQLGIGSNAYTLAVAGHTFQLLSGTMINLGQFQYGFLPTNLGGMVASRVLANVSLSYTRFVNINSLALTQYTKLPASGIDTVSSNILKLYILNQALEPGSIFLPLIGSALQYTNFQRDTNITDVDIQLYDEWGQFLYIPDAFRDNFYISIVLTVEL